MSDRPILRQGYPLVFDHEHALWDAQQAGWPDHSPHKAMTEAVQLMRSGRADSADHPVYDPASIRNPLATRPADDDAEPVSQPRQDRR